MQLVNNQSEQNGTQKASGTRAVLLFLLYILTIIHEKQKL